MNEQRFTPGQWEVLPLEHGGTYLRIRGTRLGARFKIANVHAPKDTFPGDVIESVANARLIAAAPDLLEACATFEEWLRREEAGFPGRDFRNTPEGEAAWRVWYDENLRICALAQKQARAAISRALPQGAPNAN